MNSILKLPILLITLCWSGTQLTAQDYQLAYAGRELISNEHVGNEWAFGVWLDEDSMDKDRPVRLTAGQRYDLAVAAEEAKEKYPDRGDNSITFTTADLEKAAQDKGFYLEVTVTESNGRYAGGRAVWRFYFSLE